MRFGGVITTQSFEFYIDEIIVKCENTVLTGAYLIGYNIIKR